MKKIKKRTIIILIIILIFFIVILCLWIKKIFSLSQFFIGTVSLILAIITACFSKLEFITSNAITLISTYISFKMQNKKKPNEEKLNEEKQITIKITRSYLIYNKENLDIEGLELTYNGKIVSKNLSQLNFTIHNCGKRDIKIRADDYFELRLKSTYTWEYVKVTNCDNIEFAMIDNQNAISLIFKNKNNLLRADEYINVSAIVQFEEKIEEEKTEEEKIKIHNNIANLKQIPSGDARLSHLETRKYPDYI